MSTCLPPRPPAISSPFSPSSLSLSILQKSDPPTNTSPEAITAEYLESLAGGTAKFASLATTGLTYLENDAAIDISKGVLSQGVKIDFSRSIYDTTECASYTEIVATTKHGMGNHGLLPFWSYGRPG